MKCAAIPLLLGLLLLGSMTPNALSSEYTSKNLNASVYADGTVTVIYGVEVDPSLVRIEIPLFGFTFTDLLVVNELGIPLVANPSGSNVTVDSLGSLKLTLTYSTPELTSKIGILWTLNVTSPTNFVATMPSGATIVSVSQIPLNVKAVEDRTQITLPPGSNQVSYVISVTAVRDHADSVIMDAETTIKTVKDKGVITAEADSLLAQAKMAFNATEYLNSEQLAIQAKTSALNIDSAAQVAMSTIQTAVNAVQAAKNEGRISNLADAEALLAEAQSKYTSGDYTGAKISAELASASATASQSETNYTLIIVGAATLVIAAVAAYLYNKRRKSQTKQAPEKQVAQRKSEDGAVNLESIFKKHADLRVDDKEVLRFLAEHRGEAFANEIRDRFDIPRTSTWRMIRRLISLGIVEERKIGGQSLIYVVKKYREAQE